MEHDKLSIEEMPFIYVPIVQKYAEVFRILMSIPTLWSYDDIIQIAIFLKQIKWREGLKIFFKSQSVHQQYSNLSML